jgi:hypothetical protein
MSTSTKLSDYFQKTQGIGVLATADASGQVNQAIYGRPHFLDENDDGTCSFIMSNRLSHDKYLVHFHIEGVRSLIGNR